jgi:hypothetical protein
LLVAHFPEESIQAKEKPNRERGTGAQTSPSRQVSHMVDLDSAFDRQKLQAGSYGRVFNLTIAPHVLDLRIGDTAVVLEEGRQSPTGYVAALVDCGGQHGTTVLSIPNWIICATAEE